MLLLKLKCYVNKKFIEIETSSEKKSFYGIELSRKKKYFIEIELSYKKNSSKSNCYVERKMLHQNKNVTNECQTISLNIKSKILYCLICVLIN